MKQLLSIFIFFSLFSISCDKCDDLPAACQEQPPNQDAITCEAYWETWIYNESSGECEKMSYSGCDPVGFETEKECEACECN